MNESKIESLPLPIHLSSPLVIVSRENAAYVISARDDNFYPPFPWESVSMAWRNEGKRRALVEIQPSRIQVSRCFDRYFPPAPYIIPAFPHDRKVS